MSDLPCRRKVPWSLHQCLKRPRPAAPKQNPASPWVPRSRWRRTQALQAWDCTYIQRGRRRSMYPCCDRGGSRSQQWVYVQLGILASRGGAFRHTAFPLDSRGCLTLALTWRVKPPCVVTPVRARVDALMCGKKKLSPNNCFVGLEYKCLFFILKKRINGNGSTKALVNCHQPRFDSAFTYQDTIKGSTQTSSQ